MPRLSAFVAGAILVTSTVVCGADADRDGLDDALEDQLLQDNAPHLWMYATDDRLPADFKWFIEHSQLEVADVGTGAPNNQPICINRRIVYSESQLLADYTLAITFFDSHRSSDYHSFRRFPSEHNFGCIYLNINDEYYDGQSQDEVATRKNVGLYGHVAPVRQASTGQSLIVVQYFQLYAFNDADFGGFYNHEGDWNEYEVFLVESGQPVAAVWYAHGEQNCRHLSGYALTGLRTCDGASSTVTSLQQHADVYVGYNDHEFYPTPVPGQTNFFDYQTESVPNVGEVLYPRTGYEVLLRYNAFWGDGGGVNGSPEGIMHNSGLQWQWPTMRRKHVDGSGQWWDGNATYPQGSFGQPYRTVGEAAASVTSEDTSVIGSSTYLIIDVGNFSESLTLNKPVIVMSREGVVSIGR